jgi:hypothetical protein
MDQAQTPVVAGRSALVTEMGTGDLGDHRLDARRDRLISVLEQHPDAAFPDACADDAEVEALYRFLRNPRVTLASLVEPHLVATQARCAALGDVLVIHDTTDMVFAGEAARPGLAPLGPARHGFWVHAALAVSAEGYRAPLGLLAVQPFVRKMRPRGTAKPATATRFVDPDKESRYWAEGVAAVRTRLGTSSHPIHVMDRAGDSYELFAEMIARHDRFVIRLNHDRRVVPTDGVSRVREAGTRSAVLGQRTVTVSSRRAGDRSPEARQRHPPREGRAATVQFTACPLTVQRPYGRAYAHLPATLQVQVVSAWELVPPAGEEPVDWRLITTEPIDTIEQVLRIVDWYRTRWLIEEFFKALKTGCAYEKRQLESLETLLIALALLAPIAWQLLLLRHLARADPAAPASAVLSSRQLQVLHHLPAGTHLGLTPTAGEALLLVARLGGHLRQNGAPGWLVLGRGLQKLRWMEAGWASATTHARCDQS